MDNLHAAPVFYRDIVEQYPDNDITIVSPDIGGIARAREIATRLNCNLAIIDKRREQPGTSDVMNIIGNIKDKRCILVDDIVDSAGTLCKAAQALTDSGARSVSAYSTHGVLSDGALEKVRKSPLESLVITDSIRATEAVTAETKVRQLTVAPLMADAIGRISEERSVSCLFE